MSISDLVKMRDLLSSLSALNKTYDAEGLLTIVYKICTCQHHMI